MILASLRVGKADSEQSKRTITRAKLLFAIPPPQMKMNRADFCFISRAFIFLGTSTPVPRQRARLKLLDYFFAEEPHGSEDFFLRQTRGPIKSAQQAACPEPLFVFLNLIDALLR